MIARPAGGIDLRRIGHIRKIEAGFDADADGVFLFMMAARVLWHGPLLRIEE